MPAIAQKSLIIFDCDGVLVDSEPLATRVLQLTLADLGLPLSMDVICAQFLGRSPPTIARTLERDYGLTFGAAEEERMRQRLFALFGTELQPMPGIASLLEHLTTPYCLASSSQMERIKLALSATGLTRFFTGRLYNAAMVARGKPAPDLFLHAAAACGAAPEDCVVIEDSPAGVEAAQRAGMAVIAFVGGGHAQGPVHRDALAALQPDYIAENMAELSRLLGATTVVGSA